MGHFPDALTYCDEILSRDPKNPGARFLKALALVNSARADEGRQVLDGLLKDNPNSLIAKLAKARLRSSTETSTGSRKAIRRISTSLARLICVRWTGCWQPTWRRINPPRQLR